MFYQYSPSDEVEAAINELITELKKEKGLNMTRGAALACFVDLGMVYSKQIRKPRKGEL